MNLLKLNQTFSTERIWPLLPLQRTDDASIGRVCPFCKSNRWTVQTNPATREEWQHCDQCNRSGSPLTMASLSMKMSIEDTALALAARMKSDLPVVELKRYAQYDVDRLELTKIWRDAQAGVAQPSTAHLRLLAMMGWTSTTHFDGPKALEGPGKLFGLTNYGAVRSYVKLEGCKANSACLLIPYYSAPNKIDGFRVVTENDSEFITIGPNVAQNLHSRIRGLAFYDYAKSAVGDIVVLTSMLKPAGMLHALSYDRPEKLPILAWDNTGEPNAGTPWWHLSGARLVFWEVHITPALIQHALSHEAMVYYNLASPFDNPILHSHVTEQMRRWGTQMDPESRFKSFLRKAEPIEKVLARWRTRASHDDFRKLLEAAEQFPADVFNLISKYTSKTQKYEQRLPPSVTCWVGTGKRKISLTERGKQVYHPDGKIAFPATVRVTHITANAAGDVRYAGEITSNIGSVSFSVLEALMTPSYFFNLLQTKQPQFVSYVEKFSESKLVDSRTLVNLSLIRHKPILGKAIEKIGWDGVGFQFSRMRICKGETHKTAKQEVETENIGPDISYFREDGTFEGVVSEVSNASQFYWALASAMCAVATSPLVELHPLPIFIDRDMLDKPIAQLFQDLKLTHTKKVAWKHNWFRRYRSNLYQKSEIAPPWTIGVTSEVKATALYGTGCYVVQSRMAVRSTRMTAHVMGIVLRYLKHFSALEVPVNHTQWGTWHDFTMRQMNECFSTIKSASFSTRSSNIYLKEQ